MNVHNPFVETSEEDNVSYLREDRKYAIIEKLQKERELRRKYVAEGRGQDFKL
jgi:hypothetical protein